MTNTAVDSIQDPVMVVLCFGCLPAHRPVPLSCRLASAGVLRALARSGGACLWHSGLAGYDDARAVCLSGLEDPSHEVRTAFAQTLGEIVVASTSDAGACLSGACLVAHEVAHAYPARVAQA